MTYWASKAAIMVREMMQDIWVTTPPEGMLGLISALGLGLLGLEFGLGYADLTMLMGIAREGQESMHGSRVGGSGARRVIIVHLFHIYWQ